MVMKKAIIWTIWILIWATPVIVAMCGNSPVLMLVALVWAVILFKFTMAFAPKWMKDVLNQVFVDEVNLD